MHSTEYGVIFFFNNFDILSQNFAKKIDVWLTKLNQVLKCEYMTAVYIGYMLEI